MHVLSDHEEQAPSVLFLHGGIVAGWMWQDQVAALPDHHCLVPDLPGFGASAGRPWTSATDVTDQLATVIAERAHGGRAHVVGLSLGGVLASMLVARHPGVVRSALITGALVAGLHGPMRWFSRAQLGLFRYRWYWTAQARVMGLPEDATEMFVRDGLGMDREGMARLTSEIYSGLGADDMRRLQSSEVPILAVVGDRDARQVRRSLTSFISPASLTRVAPGMHHAWNAEDPDLFNTMMRQWLEHRSATAELLAAS